MSTRPGNVALGLHLLLSAVLLLADERRQRGSVRGRVHACQQGRRLTHMHLWECRLLATAQPTLMRAARSGKAAAVRVAAVQVLPPAAEC